MWLHHDFIILSQLDRYFPHNALKDLFMYKAFWVLKIRENLFIGPQLISKPYKK